MNSNQLNILLADDDTDDCAFFKEALAEIPLSTHLIAVHDGEQLMHLLVNETTILPDVIFLDLNMPRKNGFECLSEIKLSASLRQLSVIVFSTSFEQEVVNLLYQKGALHFIRKPSEFMQFKDIIQKSLELVLHGTISQPSRENFVLAISKDLPGQAY
jgi:CheY-like chemotaxis protein